MVAINAGLAVGSFIGAWHLWRLARATFVERLQVLMIALHGATATLRPLPLFLPEAAPTLSTDSPYWLGVTASDVVISTILVLAIFTIVALDIFARLHRDSAHDALSGLLNRRGFEEAAGRILGGPAGIGAPATLILADLDHFKRINDTWGHVAGDDVIVAFAERLKAAAGDDAMTARVGGEEFVVLLPAANTQVGQMVAEGIRSSFAADLGPGLSSLGIVTASFGVAEVAPGESLDDCLKRADGALYRAKAQGRNRVRVAEVARPARDDLRAVAAGVHTAR